MKPVQARRQPPGAAGASKSAKHVSNDVFGIEARVRGSSARYGGFSSELEAVLANRIAIAGLPSPEVQFRFCPDRRWRADFAYPAAMLLIEADGGTWTGGRHVRGKGFEADCEKTSTAAAMGYRVIRLTREMIEDGRAVRLIAQALGVSGDYGRK
jgi:very-short-patch-repair endonuclease